MSYNFSSFDLYAIFIFKLVNFSYKTALDLRSEVQLSLEQKDIENAIMVLKIVFQNFQSIVNDKCSM